MLEDSLIKRLVSTLKCSGCGKHYHASRVRILEHQGNLWFLKIYCTTCRTRYLVTALIEEHEVADDLTAEERPRFEYVSPIISNDVLDMHDFLKEFDGDFAQLFSII